MNAMPQALATPVLWFSVRRTKEDGRRGRDFQVWSADGSMLLRASADNWGRDIPVRQQIDGTDTPFILLRRRRLFPVTGVVDILDPASQRLGIVRRSLRFAPSIGRPSGRFRDARKLRGQAGEAVLAAVVDTMLSGAGDSEISGPRNYLCEIDGVQAGALTAAALPFPVEEPKEPSATARTLRRVLPRWLGDRLTTARAPRGWKLEWQNGAPAMDPRVTIGAVLFTLELHQWR